MNLKTRPIARRVTALALALSMLLASDALALTQYSTLEFGSRGSIVLKLQKALLALGFDPSGTDGKFGRGTETAVIQYQTSKGLTADGKAGTTTLNALFTDAESAQSTDTATTA
ncbi:MAG TPA: peptidoglycan-binding domain-containing protein, partial [Candidatus Limiplasma sp.]|nr:peptidoglycan-binding domain-containing protein [Candidatus Limiplasma sp.]